MNGRSSKAVFIINPKSGTPKFVSRLHYLIRKHLGVSNRNISVHKSRRPGQVREIAERAVGGGCDLVVAVGGDGTVNSVAEALVDTDTALGVIPTGSGNGFARNLDIPLRIDRAIESLKSYKLIEIDVGRVGDNLFLVSCGIGWEAVIATLFEGSRIRGVMPYVTSAISTFLQYEPQEITITSDPGGWEYKGRPLMFSVANMKEFGVGVTIAPEARFDDGLLDICLIPRHTLLNAIKYTPEMFRERADMIPGYICHLGSDITIKRPLAGNIHIDGSPIACGETITITTLPRALKVAVPDRVVLKKKRHPA